MPPAIASRGAGRGPRAAERGHGCAARRASPTRLGHRAGAERDAWSATARRSRVVARRSRRAGARARRRRRRDEQQERGDLERQQEAVSSSSPICAGRAEAARRSGAPSLSIAFRPEPSDGDRTARRTARRRTATRCPRRPRPPGRAHRLVAAADVGDDEDVEHHHRAGVDDDLRGGDELRAQQQEQRGQRRAGGTTSASTL